MSDIVSHDTFSNFEEAKGEILSRVKDKNLLSLLNELESCSLGRFLIQHRGLNAYWTKRITENKGGYDNAFEEKLITIPPVFVATQQRSIVFIDQVNKLSNESFIMSVPAGLLPEFDSEMITIKSFKIDAYDLDPSCANKTDLSKLSQVSYFAEDIFEVDLDDKYDAAVSNGLNIYLETNLQVKNFYQIISKSLKKSGVLIGSFINDISAVDTATINRSDMRFSKEIFVDLLDIGWKKTHPESEFVEILKSCNFEIKEIIYDKHKMFPTVIATKK